MSTIIHPERGNRWSRSPSKTSLHLCESNLQPPVSQTHLLHAHLEKTFLSPKLVLRTTQPCVPEIKTLTKSTASLLHMSASKRREEKLSGETISEENRTQGSSKLSATLVLSCYTAKVTLRQHSALSKASPHPQTNVILTKQAKEQFCPLQQSKRQVRGRTPRVPSSSLSSPSCCGLKVASFVGTAGAGSVTNHAGGRTHHSLKLRLSVAFHSATVCLPCLPPFHSAAPCVLWGRTDRQRFLSHPSQPDPPSPLSLSLSVCRPPAEWLYG